MRTRLISNKYLFLLFLGNRAFESVEFNSTIYVDSSAGQGTIGVVFGFQSTKVFYIVMWKKGYPNPGLAVKVRKAKTPFTRCR